MTHLRTTTACVVAGCLAWSAALAQVRGERTETLVQATAEQQVEAVRRALVSQSLQQPLRVTSHAWIDGEGRLHEDAQFSSGMTVRGVRVSTYLDEHREAQAEIDPGALDKPTLADPATCRAQSPAWRRLALVHTQVAANWPAPQRSLALQLINEVGHGVRAMGRGQSGWQPTEAAWRPSSRYEAALVGPAQRDTDWSLELTLSPAAAPLALPPSTSARHALGLWGIVSTQAPWAMRLELRWSDRRDPQRQRVWSGDVVVRPSAPVADARDALKLSSEVLQGQVKRWLSELDDALACEPVVADVEHKDQQWTLLLGHSSGIRAGDRVVLMDRQRLPERVLEPAALQGMGIAQVASVEAGRAQLQWLGGPRPAASSDWVAVPMRLAPRL